MRFTFLTITYNHEKYVLEHLESIRHLVQTFGSNISVDLILADDGSKDGTLFVVNAWIKKHGPLFAAVYVLGDGVNRGTCKNLLNALAYNKSEFCKITAGDDVYSCENIFAELAVLPRHGIASGLPLNLIDSKLEPTKFQLWNIFSTNNIYRRESYLSRLKGICFFNTPNLIYSHAALQDSRVLNFMGEFAVTEDFPLQIKMAELYPAMEFIQVNKVLVYYRRTAGSTYLIRKSAYDLDKQTIFKHLILIETSTLRRFILKNRLFCYNVNNKIIRKVANISIMLYAIRCLLHCVKSTRDFLNFDRNVSKHQKHYEEIAAAAVLFARELEN